ncbi:MAG TPA: thiamine pyrophosphate-binding protein [Thermodesulfobacteriota bacterium]
MAKVHGGWLVAKTLNELGVKEIFSLSGGHINPIYDACQDFGIRIIDTHHEQGASMAADAYGRVKRKPAICLVTAGPGFTNTVTGIAGAYLSNSPLILLSGKSGIEEQERLPLQDIDQQSIISPITKWASTIFDTKRIPEYITTAYKKAITGKPGPVYLGMPYEVLYASCNEEQVNRYNTVMPSSKVEPPQESITQAIEMFKASTRPLAIAGSGAWYADADKELLRFLDNVKIPIYTLNFGRGIVSDNHKQCFGAASLSGPVGFKKISSEADLILLLGIRLSLYIGFGRSFNPEAKIIQVDIDPGEIGRNRPADLGIVSDISKFLFHFSNYIEENSIKLTYEPWFKQARTWRDEEWEASEEIRNSDKTPIHALRVIKEVEEMLGEDGMLVIDGGDTQAWTDGTYRVRKPGHYVKGGPLGCMGVGVPFAIGTKVACPEKQVALISGDGAIGMNFMEFETAIRHKIPFVAVVCNDQSWGMTKHQLWLTYGRERPTVGVDLELTPFHEMVKVLGGYGELVTEPAKIRGAIERAISSGVPSLINITTDPEAISPSTYGLTQMMLPKEN